MSKLINKFKTGDKVRFNFADAKGEGVIVDEFVIKQYFVRIEKSNSADYKVGKILLFSEETLWAPESL